jgi:hypothetical protein
VAVLLLALPYVIYTQLLPEEKLVFLFLIYTFIVLLFGGIYLLLENNIKNKHRSTFAQVQKIRRQMALIRRKINNIRKGILKDKDESVYELEDFDREVLELEEELNKINSGKKEALGTFENSTRNVIRDEINQQHQEELLRLKKNKLEVLIQLMNEKNIATISEAIAYYRTEQTEN